jgi:hypothetical protein
MQVQFESRDPEGRRLRDAAVQRLRFVLRRLAWLVPRARVRLDDVNGPGGGVDKRCRVELKTDTHGTVIVTSLARDWRTAIDGAFRRAARVVVQSWQRRRAPRRQKPLALRHQS